MKPNSISGVTYRVSDLSKTSQFYETIGFRRGKEESDRATFYVNWFFVTLIARDEAEPAVVGEGTSLCVKVINAGEFHESAVSAGLKPEGEPERQPNGNLEFVLRDPDGYSLTFFQKK